MTMSFAVLLLGEIRDGVERKWSEPGWLVWARPGALDARWRSVGWSPDVEAALRFATQAEAVAASLGLMPTGYVCQVVEVDDA
jgi:hypothetical protein